MRTDPLKTLAALTSGLALTCSPPQPVLRTMWLESWQPRSSEGVYLNEDLVFTFSSEVDFTTVTDRSFRIVDDAGGPASGRLVVDGRTVRFEPAPVLAAALSDGGYRPGKRYTVEVAGFPRLDGLRGVHGELLERAFTWTFQAVEVTSPGFVFDDASPQVGSALKLVTRFIGPLDPIELHCIEPLDPSTLRDEDFHLVPEGGDQERIELRATLVANYDEGTQPPAIQGELFAPCAIIQLIPKSDVSPGRYTLRFDHRIALRDFGGNGVYRPAHPTETTMIHVRENVAREGRGELKIDFLERNRSSPLPVPGADGTALWKDTGFVAVRYPAAAGDGRDGAVQLGAQSPASEFQATRLELQKGSKYTLAPGPGLRVLRAQGRMQISGDLLRTTEERDQPMDFTGVKDLSTWLARAQADDPDWTVLIAGGDLVIDGTVDVDTPLLLVAGGLIRVAGKIEGGKRRGKSELWLLGEGGGLNLKPLPSSCPLAMDAPVTNELVESLTFSAVSTPIPPVGHATRWLTARAGGIAGSGEWRVRYVPSRDSEVPVNEAVHHPWLLSGTGPIRILIELVVNPGGTWDPPSLDYVDLTWEP